MNDSVEHYVHSFIEDLPVGIARNDTTGREPNHFNRYMLEMFGWDASEVDSMEKWFIRAYPDAAYRESVLKRWSLLVEETEKSNKLFSAPMHVKVRCKDMSDKWCEVRYYRKEHYMYGIFTDISELKLIGDNLKSANLQYEALLSSTLDGYWCTDTNGFIIDVNEAAHSMLGYSKDEMIGMHIAEIDAIQERELIQKNITFIMQKGHHRFETKHLHKNGTIIDTEISASFAPMQSGLFFVLVRDISERILQQRYAALRLELSTLIQRDSSKEQILQTALDLAESITQSAIGFYHFVDEDQENVSLQVWSSNTLEKMCFAEGHSFHYPISQAGVWVDCIHQRKSLIYNDYEALPHKKGLPEGHAPLQRFITVPLFRNDKVVAILGVGNKVTDYTQNDKEIAETITEIAYEYYEHHKAESQIAFMAHYDVLTGLPNRVLFSDRILQARAHARRNDQLVAVCFLDLDGFKPVNDTYGHHVGDALLKELAERFQAHLREGDTTARLGGDEFALLINGIKYTSEVNEVLNRILELVNRAFVIGEHRIHISCSIGATIYPTDDNDADTLLRHADIAMYQAKEQGKSNFVIYEMIEDLQYQEEQQLLEAFKEGLQKGEVSLYYQPKVSLKDASIIGFEGLSRWHHPEKGLLYPGVFLPVVENTAVEFMLGEWVVAEAMKTLQSWHEKGMQYTLSVNISPRHIQLMGFAEYLRTLLASYSSELVHYLELEILEIAAIEDMQNVVDVMNICTDLGVRFSLDDFGTGYSSLTHFHRLPIDVLKIDQAFVKDMIDNKADLDIVEGVMKLATTLDRPVVAEGVEIEEVALLLLYLGCQYAQGYGIAKPMALENVEPWIKQWKRDDTWQSIITFKGRGLSHDINVAIFSHQRWVQRVIEYVENPARTIAVSSPSACIFGRWYKGAGHDRFGAKESYSFIQAKHYKAHETADMIITLIHNKAYDEAKRMIEQLKADEQELVELLLTMEKQP